MTIVFRTKLGKASIEAGTMEIDNISLNTI